MGIACRLTLRPETSTSISSPNCSAWTIPAYVGSNTELWWSRLLWELPLQPQLTCAPHPSPCYTCLQHLVMGVFSCQTRPCLPCLPAARAKHTEDARGPKRLSATRLVREHQLAKGLDLAIPRRDFSDDLVDPLRHGAVLGKGPADDAACNAGREHRSAGHLAWAPAVTTLPQCPFWHA
jgi:hypothetical protein